ncbi:NADH dehydrogenase [ubiquinone] 1 alpha subcomplex subunit 6-like [Triticum dicoccoides]|uniref:NADH dehydrogenase [ubiquinone] 1 alpha subcomplex subunit 6-like n=1 Tax=Triticum dicoccoides TaxID=85692 RepID=UPI00188FAC3B|nr:NADH dehydrogenase [ubiquinone] 1 alpha subcomplex subunit 6-like [Triticum dicoccoides]
MAFTMRAVKVPPNSASMAEARHRVFDFFRDACRAIPSIMEIYNLDDVVTPAQLRASISQQIRKNQGSFLYHCNGTTMPGKHFYLPQSDCTSLLICSDLRANKQVIDMLLFNGMEELNNITEHAKQRHHIIGQYVVGHKGLVQDLEKDQGSSEFLKKFYTSNY